jgi:hypothetical protein
MDERKKLARNSMEAARIQLAGILCSYLLSEKAAMLEKIWADKEVHYEYRNKI